MKFKKIDDTYVVRLEKGEEIMQTLQKFCAEQAINSAKISGIGAAKQVVLKIYNPETKEYDNINLEEYYEIASLNGNVTMKDNNHYLHVHVVLADKHGKAIAGHLEKATITATLEAFIKPINETIEREYNEEVNLNLLKL